MDLRSFTEFLVKSIVKEPDIKKEQIAINSYKQLEQIVPENYFLKDGSDK